jgi:hypothetical protein
MGHMTCCRTWDRMKHRFKEVDLMNATNPVGAVFLVVTKICMKMNNWLSVLPCIYIL